ncbi:MAG: RidA family protein [Thermoanaerobaculia bacterium]|nr:RidA family protein [Thermoanaerobaculia bacterium]
MSRPSLRLVVLVVLVAVAVAAGAAPKRVVVPGLGRLPAFSHATIVGDVVFVAGTLGTRADPPGLVPGGVGAETTQTIRNIERILEEVGATLEDVAKCTVYLTDMDDFQAMNEAWMPYFGDHPPARAAVAVAELALGAKVEIECIAALPATD